MDFKAVSEFLDCDKWSIPGYQCVIRQHGELVFEEYKGFADVANKEPMSLKHYVPMGSLMHSLLSAMMINLMRVSTVPMDASLAQIAKHYRQDGGRLAITLSTYPQLRSLTVTHLLQHTSGLPSYDQTEVFISALMRNPKKSWQLEAYLDMITGSDIEYCYGYRPGKKGEFSYSTTNLLIASLVVAAITGHDMIDELQLFANRHYPEKALFASLRDNDVIDRLPMVHGYVHPSCPYIDLFKDCPTTQYGDGSETKVYDVTKARNLSACADIVGYTTVASATKWLSSIWVDDHFGPASQTFFPSPVLATELTSEGFPIYSGLGSMQTVYPHVGSVYWMQGFMYGYETAIMHVAQSGVTLGIMFNISRELLIADQSSELLHDFLIMLHNT